MLHLVFGIQSPWDFIEFIFLYAFFPNAEINLMDYRPSTIAAAATLIALDERPTRKTLEWKMNSISSGGFLEIVSNFFINFSHFLTIR